MKEYHELSVVDPGPLAYLELSNGDQANNNLFKVQKIEVRDDEFIDSPVDPKNTRFYKVLFSIEDPNLIENLTTNETATASRIQNLNSDEQTIEFNHE